MCSFIRIHYINSKWSRSAVMVRYSESPFRENQMEKLPISNRKGILCLTVVFVLDLTKLTCCDFRLVNLLHPLQMRTMIVIRRRYEYVRICWHCNGRRGRCRWYGLLARISPQLRCWCATLNHISLHSKSVSWFWMNKMKYTTIPFTIWNAEIFWFHLQSALIERVFLIAPLHDILLRNWRGRNVVWRTLTVLLWLKERKRCSFK